MDRGCGRRCDVAEARREHQADNYAFEVHSLFRLILWLLSRQRHFQRRPKPKVDRVIGSETSVNCRGRCGPTLPTSGEKRKVKMGNSRMTTRTNDDKVRLEAEQ